MKIAGILLALAVLLVSASPVLEAKDEWTSLTITVKDEAGEPVPRASLIVRELKGKKLQKVGKSLELRASNQGSAPLPPIKRGVVLVQVIADGYQTFGDRYELTEPEQNITITLKPPQKQYSVHEK